jgi:CHRD domain
MRGSPRIVGGLLLIGGIGAFSFVVGIGSAAAETVVVVLTSANEVPPNTSPGKGEANVDYDKASKKLTYKLTYSGLTGDATAAHFHGPAAPGANAGVVIPIGSGAPANPTEGSATLTDAQAADLLAGKWYVNVHTKANPGGEIRGQVVPK